MGEIEHSGQSQGAVEMDVEVRLRESLDLRER
jgi:hypothetical protein